MAIVLRLASSAQDEGIAFRAPLWAEEDLRLLSTGRLEAAWVVDAKSFTMLEGVLSTWAITHETADASWVDDD